MTVLFINGKQYTLYQGKMFHADGVGDMLSHEELVALVCCLKDIVTESEC